MKELSIFIDESGDFGDYQDYSPYYIITMVFHDQSLSIESAIAKLNQELAYMKLDDLCIHTGPIIRREEIYQNMTVQERRQIFNKLVAFTRQIPIKYKCFSISKKYTDDPVQASVQLTRKISAFIRDHYEDFLSCDSVKLYYDNGQIEVSRILAATVAALIPSSVFRKVMPKDYKLFQVADLICSLELIRIKVENKAFSKSEALFFGNQRDLKRNYLKHIAKKEWN